MTSRLLQPLTQRWRTLVPRERLMLVGGSLVAVLSLMFVLVVDPLLERQETLDRQIGRKHRALRELAALGADYGAVRGHLARAERQIAEGRGTFSLLPYLEDATTALQMRDRIVGMQPTQSPPAQGYQEMAVELRLEGVQWPQLLGLLVKLEDSPYLLQVKRVQIRPRFDAPHLLEATLLVSTYEKA